MDIDKLLRAVSENRIAETRPGRTLRCPSESDLIDYINGHLSAAGEKAVKGHIAACLYCLEQIEQLKHHLHLHEDKEAHRPPQALVDKVKDLNYSAGEMKRRLGTSKKGRGPLTGDSFRRHLWLLLAIIVFGLSFLLPMYFIQCLVLAAILAIKWITLTAPTHSLLMVYESWREKRNIKSGNRLEDRTKSSFPR